MVNLAFLLSLRDVAAKRDLQTCLPLVAKRFEQRLARMPAEDRTEARMNALLQEVVDRLVEESDSLH